MFQEEIQRDDIETSRQIGSYLARPSKRPRGEIGTVCQKCLKPGHLSEGCWCKITCDNCGKQGHPPNKVLA
jgi:hypothetical protein